MLRIGRYIAVQLLNDDLVSDAAQEIGPELRFVL